METPESGSLDAAPQVRAADQGGRAELVHRVAGVDPVEQVAIGDDHGCSQPSRLVLDIVGTGPEGEPVVNLESGRRMAEYDVHQFLDQRGRLARRAMARVEHGQ